MTAIDLMRKQPLMSQGAPYDASKHARAEYAAAAGGGHH
jgi:hypothetical protein